MGRARGSAGERGGPPVPAAQQHSDGGDEQGADKEGVQHYSERDGEAELLGFAAASGQAQDREGAGQDDPGGGDGAAGDADRAGEGGGQARLMVGFLADAGHDQDVVVLAQCHGEHEHQQGQHEDQPAAAAEVDEDDHGEAEGGQVGQAHSGGQVPGSDQAAQQQPEQDQDQRQDDRDHERERGVGGGVDVVGGGVLSGDAVFLGTGCAGHRRD